MAGGLGRGSSGGGEKRWSLDIFGRESLGWFGM